MRRILSRINEAARAAEDARRGAASAEGIETLLVLEGFERGGSVCVRARSIYGEMMASRVSSASCAAFVIAEVCTRSVPRISRHAGSNLASNGAE